MIIGINKSGCDGLDNFWGEDLDREKFYNLLFLVQPLLGTKQVHEKVLLSTKKHEKEIYKYFLFIPLHDKSSQTTQFDIGAINIHI